MELCNWDSVVNYSCTRLTVILLIEVDPIMIVVDSNFNTITGCDPVVLGG